MRFLWAIPALFALHNMEEGLFAWRFLASDTVPLRLRSLAGHFQKEYFIAVLIVITLIPVLVAALGDMKNPTGRAARLLLLLQAIICANVFWHLAVAISLCGYAPGLVTALLVNLPFSIYVLRRSWQERWVNRSAVAGVWLTAVIVQAIAFVTYILP